MLKTIDVHQVQERLQEILSEVYAGIEITLTDGNIPIARVVPVSARVAGLHAGKIWTSADFDEPLSEDFWTGDM